MFDKPAVTRGSQGVAIAAEVVQPDLGDHGEVRADVRLIGRQPLEQDIGEVVPDDRLDVTGDGDVGGDAAEEGGKPARVTGPVVARQ